jgi:hypothetical protein
MDSLHVKHYKDININKLFNDQDYDDKFFVKAVKNLLLINDGDPVLGAAQKIITF